MHGENIKLNESSQRSPIAITPGEMLVPLGDVWGLSTRTDPILPLPVGAWSWCTLALATLERFMPPKHRLWHMGLLSPAL